MRTLTTSATTEKNKLAISPINVLQIDYGGSVGTKYYSDRILSSPIVTEPELVVAWGNLNFSIVEDTGQSKSANFVIADTSQNIFGYLRSQEIYKKKFYLYQYFQGLLWTDATLLITGSVKETICRENPPEIEFIAEELLLNYDKKLGTTAVKSIFPNVNAIEDGQVLPLVYGHAERVKAIQVIESKRTSLSIPLAATSTTTIVNDSRDFPQNTSMELFIGSELVKGKFDGRLLTLTQRGRIVAASYTSAVSPNIVTFYTNGLPSQGPQWIGYSVKFFVGGREEVRQITNFTAPNLYAFSPYIGNTPIPSGTYFEIFTAATRHDTGEEVHEKLESYAWIINDAPSTEIDKIELIGSLILTGSDISKTLKDTELWVRLDENHTTINLNDSTWVSTLGHNVTSIRLPFDPKNFRNSPYKDNTLYVTLTGVDYSNPVDILVDLAKRIGFQYPGDFDLTSMAAVKSSISWIKLGFAITSKIGKELLFDIAFQARLSIKFLGASLVFSYLQNKTQTPIKTIDNLTREMDSLQIEKQEEVYNKLTVTFQEDGPEKKFEVTDAASIAIYGEREKSLELWCITNRALAEAIATFWLRRWAWPCEKVSFNGFLDQIDVEPNDWITINEDNYLSSQPAEVIGIDHIPGNSETIDKIKITARLPRWPGCASSCEQFEETGCASACQQYCTSSAQTSCAYACETGNQDACSLVCVSTCQVECTAFCQLSGCQLSKQGCSGQCQTGCTTSGCQTSGCTSSCTAGCQNACTTGAQTCETSCQIGCQLSACQTGTEGCSGECMASCVAGCQSSCETQCQGSCQTASQTCTQTCMASCQVADTTSGCKTGCELFCTTSCEQSCEQSCRTGITTTCQTSCTSSCQSTCQGQCEGTCQAECQAAGTESYSCTTQCQTGCINFCETTAQSQQSQNTCATTCEGYCMTSTAQVGCMLFCTVGCMVSCEVTCEDACRSGCETKCESGCQTTVEPSPCTASTEGACYSNCQIFCETGCTTNCQVDCQANCMLLSCQSSCQIYCTTSCRSTCQSTCQINCRVTCQSACQSTTCQTGLMLDCAIHCTSSNETYYHAQCKTVCESYCTTTCNNFCQTGCTSACAGSCQAHCMTSSCQSSCQVYCTTGCRSSCQSTCQCFCRTGCESACQAVTCQTISQT